MSQPIKTKSFLRGMILFLTIVWAFNLYFLFTNDPNFQIPIGFSNNEKINSLLIAIILITIPVYMSFNSKDKIAKLYWVTWALILFSGLLWDLLLYTYNSLTSFPFYFVRNCMFLAMNVIFYQIYLRIPFNLMALK